MKTMQFEALKVALKQDKTGYVLTLCMHPDEIPVELLRDFVGARYQVVMVRIDAHERPMDRQDQFDGERHVKNAGILCRDPQFWAYLQSDNQILTATEKEATDWLREYLCIQSRAELKDNKKARERLDLITKEYHAWKEKT